MLSSFFTLWINSTNKLEAQKMHEFSKTFGFETRIGFEKKEDTLNVEKKKKVFCTIFSVH